jgi:hypothetical protein
MFMTHPLYQASIPVFSQMLKSMLVILEKAEQHALAKNIDAQVFLQARLAADMFPLIRQVQIAADFAKSVSARMAEVEMPNFEDKEASFADLQERIKKTLSFMETIKPEQFAGSEARDIVLRPGTPKEKRLDGQTYLLHYGLPQFFFHVTTHYAILRHLGLEVGKKDYMGQY